MLLQEKVCTTVKQKDCEGAYLMMNPASFVFLFIYLHYRLIDKKNDTRRANTPFVGQESCVSTMQMPH